MDTGLVLRAVLHRAEALAESTRNYGLSKLNTALKLARKIRQLGNLRPKNIYVTVFDSLKCAEDVVGDFLEGSIGIPRRIRYNAKHKSNIIALWRFYKRIYGLDHTKASDCRISCYTNNERLARFLNHMTKWNVFVSDSIPNSIRTKNIYAFLLNPDLRTIKNYNFVVGNKLYSRAEEMVVISSRQTIDFGFDDMYVDGNVISPNRFLGKGRSLPRQPTFG